MKKSMLFILVATLLVLIIKIVMYDGRDENEMLVNAFSNGKYVNTVSHISVDSKPFEGYYSEEERETFLKNIASKIGIDGNYDLVKNSNENEMVIEIDKNAARAFTKIKMVTIEKQISKTDIKVTNYLYVEMDVMDSYESAVIYKDRIKKALEEMGITMNISLSLCGYVNGFIDKEEREMIAEKMIEEMNGEIIDRKCIRNEGVNKNNQENKADEECCTDIIYGYSSSVIDYVMLLGKKVNINIAFTYDEINNQTVIYMATPIINEDI